MREPGEHAPTTPATRVQLASEPKGDLVMSTPAPTPRTPRTAKATEAAAQNAAARAVDDPRQLARAARIVRAALDRQRLTLADIVPTPDEAAS